MFYMNMYIYINILLIVCISFLSEGTKPPCQLQDLLRNKAFISSFDDYTTPEYILSIPTAAILDDLCMYVQNMIMKNISNFLDSCVPNPDDRIIYNIIRLDQRNVEALLHHMCRAEPTSFKKDYFPFFKCYTKYKDAYEPCKINKEKWENIKGEAVCQKLKHVITCYFLKASNKCNEKAGLVIRKVVKLVLNIPVRRVCGDLDRMTTKPLVGSDTYRGTPYVKHSKGNIATPFPKIFFLLIYSATKYTV